MPRVQATTLIQAPVDQVFAYVNDYRNSTKFTSDLLRWDPVTDKTDGLGARFEAAMKMGPTTQQATLEITGWKRNALIAWDPIAGFDSGGRYTFKREGTSTRVTFEVYFNPPGGVAGRMLGKIIEPIARQDAQKSVDNLKRNIERKRR